MMREGIRFPVSASPRQAYLIYLCEIVDACFVSSRNSKRVGWRTAKLFSGDIAQIPAVLTNRDTLYARDQFCQELLPFWAACDQARSRRPCAPCECPGARLPLINPLKGVVNAGNRPKPLPACLLAARGELVQIFGTNLADAPFAATAAPLCNQAGREAKRKSGSATSLRRYCLFHPLKSTPRFHSNFRMPVR